MCVRDNFNDDIEYKVDGDACNFTILFTKEAIDEINKMLDSVEFYITPDIKITYTSSTGPVDYVLQHMSMGEPI